MQGKRNKFVKRVQENNDSKIAESVENLANQGSFDDYLNRTPESDWEVEAKTGYQRNYASRR